MKLCLHARRYLIQLFVCFFFSYYFSQKLAVLRLYRAIAYTCFFFFLARIEWVIWNILFFCLPIQIEEEKKKKLLLLMTLSFFFFFSQRECYLCKPIPQIQATQIHMHRCAGEVCHFITGVSAFWFSPPFFPPLSDVYFSCCRAGGWQKPRREKKEDQHRSTFQRSSASVKDNVPDSADARSSHFSLCTLRYS